MEFKDLSGIRLNKTLPSTVHPWVDPDHPLPARLPNGDPRIIHGDPYCTKLTANARAEIQLAGNFSLGGGEANLPTETRNEIYYARANSYIGDNQVIFDRPFPLHKNDCLVQMFAWQDGRWLRITDYNSIENKVTLDGTIRFIDEWQNGTWGLLAGGICINVLSTSQTQHILTANIKVGTLTCIGHRTTEYEYALLASDLNMIANRVSYAQAISGNSYPSSTFLSKSNAFINQIITKWLFSNSFINNSNFGKGNHIEINDGVVYALCSHTNSSIDSIIKINKCERLTNVVANLGAIGIIYYIKDVNQLDLHIPTSNKYAYYVENCTVSNELFTGFFAKAGKVKKENNTWHHKPNTSSDTTWKYADHLVPASKSLHLKVFRKVESASISSEARVAITDTANWYPQTKFRANAELVLNNLEPDKVYIKNLSWKNDSDEPVQVRIWECASGSTDAGYLKTEIAMGGAF